MAIKRKKKTLKKAVKSSAPKSGSLIATIIISAVIVAAAAAAGIVVSKMRDTSTVTTNVISTVSPDTITITDTKTGKSRKMDVLPASAGNVQITTPVPSTVTAAAAVTNTASGDFSRLLKPADTKETIPHIDIAEAKYLFDSGRALFVDARGPAEYAEGHVKGAVNIPASATPEEIEKLKGELKGKVLVTYCHGIGCHLADKTAYKLWDAGYRKIAIFFGGWPKWNEHKYPITTK